MRKLKTIIARDKEHLQKIIQEHIEKNGDKCNLNHIDVTNITDMSDLFKYSNFNGDISEWDVSNVTNMTWMFDSCHFNGDISKWNVSNVTNMMVMFLNSKFNGDISKWNVFNVQNMDSMFSNSQFNGDLSKWNVSNAKDMRYMFDKSLFTGDISKWNINDDCSLENMFVKSKYPEDGILFWHFVLNGEIKEIDDIRAAHIEKFKPILDGMGWDGVRAAKYLHQTFTNPNLELPIHNIGL